MITNGRKTIGIFISQLLSEFPEALCKSISSRALELNYNAIFFTNFGGYGQDQYDVGELQIANIPCYENLDGIILIPDTYAVNGLMENLMQNIKARTKCPVVSIRRKKDEFYNVLVDNNKIIEDLVRHFIEVHGFTRLNFLAGPKGFPDSDMRLDSYKRVLEQYNIPYEEERVFYGDFWRKKPYEAVDYWLSSSLELPQAIICANDYMAVETINALTKKGFKVPEQIAISGCDDLTDASEYSPSITTARVPTPDMGIEAMDIIFRHIEGIDQPQDNMVKTIPVFRESCGCKYNPQDEYLKHKRYYINRYTELQDLVIKASYMASDLTGLTTMEHVNSRIQHYIYENTGFTDFFLCLYSGWQNRQEDNSRWFTNSDSEMIMESGRRKDEELGRVKFKRSQLFPTEFMDDEPLIYFVAMLHHQADVFGYVAIRFQEIQTYNRTFQTWMINVGNALENVRIHSKLNRLVYKLEDMYIRDDLTGIYNRRGLELLGTKYLKQAKDEKLNLMVFSTDLDKLKSINDNYGHISGDIAIKVVADALQHAADDDEICIRCGGDEFTVIGLDYDEHKLDRFIQRFVGELDMFNQSGNAKYQVEVSYGWRMMVPGDNSTVEDYMVLSDAQMYEQKNRKREAVKV